MSTARAILSKQWDSKLALIFATMLHAFLTDPANLAAVSCKDGVNLLACLIMVCQKPCATPNLTSDLPYTFRSASNDLLLNAFVSGVPGLNFVESGNAGVESGSAGIHIIEKPAT